LFCHVECHPLHVGTEPPARFDSLRQPCPATWVVGKGELVPPRREHFGDRGSDVSCCAVDEAGRHSSTLVRLPPAGSKRWSVPRNSRRTLSPGDPANGGSTFATSRRSSVS